MNYEKLFTVTCLHQYFGGGPCSDIQIEPTEDCKKLLSRFRMIYKQEGKTTVSVSRQQAETADEIQMPACTDSLTFYLLVSNTAFYNYTKTVLQNKSNTLLFTTQSVANKPDFKVAEKPKLTLPVYYASRSLFGTLSIVPPASFKSYTLNLEATATKWRYYIVANADRNVKVSSTSPDVKFQPVTDDSRLQLDAIYKALKQSRSEAKVFLYESEKPLVFAQKPEAKVQLLDAANDTVMIDNLATPADDENGLKIIVI